jgi:AcrR family transcriptional regulator
LRQAAAEEAKRRIVEATAALHAEHGGRGTSHAMIARKAGVSIPTVYKYFPTADHLIPACTGLVAARAPLRLDEGLLKGLDGVPARVHALARALFRLHEYFSPWVRWSDADAAALPALREYLIQVRKQQVAIIRQALTAEGSKGPPERLVRLARVLLDHPSWRTLTEGGRSSDQAAREAADALLAIDRFHRHSKEKP